MFNKSKKEKDTYGIVGLGRFGFALAVELGTAGADLIVIDRDEEKVRELREYTDNAYVVKTLDKKTLEECGMQNCDIAVVCNRRAVGYVDPDDAQSGQPEHSDGHCQGHQPGARADPLQTRRKGGLSRARHGRPPCASAGDLQDPRFRSAEPPAEHLQIGDSREDRRQNRARGESARRFGINIIALETNNSLIETVNPEYVFKRGDILFISGNKARMNNFTEWVEKP